MAEWMSTSEAAERLGKTDRQIRRYCHDEVLLCKRDGKQLLVDADSLEALLHEQQSKPEETVQDMSAVEDEEDFEDTDEEEQENVDIDEEDEEEETPPLSESISSLSKKLYDARSDVRSSTQELSRVADLLHERLYAEHSKNEEFRSHLQSMMSDLSIESITPPKKTSRWKKLLRTLLWIVLLGLAYRFLYPYLLRTEAMQGLNSVVVYLKNLS